MKIDNGYILLQDVRCYAHHGVTPQENLIGNEYTLRVRLKTDVGKAARTDEVTDTVDYAKVYQILMEEMGIPSKLLEHAARRIAERLFQEFPAIEAADLLLSKRNPPIGADIEGAGVELHCSR